MMLMPCNDSYKEKINAAIDYIDSVYRIESMKLEGIFGLYALEMQRIDKHEELCNLLNISKEDTKNICLNLDKSIGFDIAELEKDYEFYIEKYAKKLILELGRI